MKNVRLKKPVLYGIWTGVFAALVVTLYYMNFAGSTLKSKENKTGDLQYVSRLFGSDDIKAVNASSFIIRPYTDDKVKIVQSFYNYKGTEKDQENSIINYEQTYIQNNGVAYGGLEQNFDVISVLDGTVTSVKEDKLLGNIIEIKASDKVTLIYQSLSEVSVKANDSVKQGDIIGKSGTSNMNKDLGNHMVFELKIDGTYVNPEDYYDKDINNL